MKWSFWWHEI